MVDVRSLFAIRKPIGKRDGNWFIRIPLWLQGTILIFSAGFLSLLILTIIAGVKTWQYSESLMKERLSNFAAMTALQVEEDFAEIQNRLVAASSSQPLLRALETLSHRDATAQTWMAFEDQFEIQFNGFPSLYAFILYDKDLRVAYTHRRRHSTQANVPSQQLSLAPGSLLPFSDPVQRSEMLKSVSAYTGGIISSRIIPQFDIFTQDPANITFSVSRGISRGTGDIYSGAIEGPRTGRNESRFIGYCTFLLNTPYTFTGNMTSSKLFNQYQAVTVQQSQVRDKNFTFLVPFADSEQFREPQLTWPISDFPIIGDADALVNNRAHLEDPRPANSSSSGTSEGDDDEFPEDDFPTQGQSPSSSRFGDPESLERRHDSASRYNIESNTVHGATLDPQQSSEYSVPGSKQGQAQMRTRAPWQKKSSIGYSWANVMNEKWLIFVQIPQSEAFNPAVHLRNVIIAVAVGILGAVVLIMAPLSRWQTRGLYIIYQNMRLRPMFVSYEEGDIEEGNNDPAVDEAEAKSGKRSDTSKSFHGHEKEDSQNSDLAITQAHPNDKFELRRSLGSSDTSEASLKDTKGWSASPETAAPRQSSHQGRVPTSLPALNRVYTDELDDLVLEYNNMVHKLNNQYLHLEDEVRMRTREAQTARELTEEANNAKSEFIAIISHELRTPLNGIMGLTSVSVEDDDVSNIKNSLALIIESGRVLMELLNELLELSKSLIGVEPSVRLFSAAKLLESLPNMFQSRASDLSVTFSLAAVPSDLNNVTLRGDIDHVVQICLNFMSNAMKFSEKNGSVSVIMHLRPYKDPYVSKEPYDGALDNANAILEILVTDSGVGMSPNQLAKIFDLFVQGDDPLRKNHRGAGLGMALSKQLAEGIGGYVAVFSAEGVGSSVVLRVPVECVGKTSVEVDALDGPPIEFKVKDVYTTLSFDSGNVMLVKQVQWRQGNSIEGRRSSATPLNSPINASTVPYPPSPNARRSRHSHQSSSGSKMLLTRAHPVTRLLRPQQQQSSHHHHQSHSTAFASLYSTGSASGSNSDGRGDLVSPMDVITGQHKNDSSSSLLLVVPPAIEEQSLSKRSRASWYTAEGSPTPPLSSRDPSPSRHRSSVTLSAAPTNTSSLPESSPFAQEGLLRPDASSPTTSAPRTGPPMVFVTSAQGSSVVSEIDEGARLLVAEDNPLNSQIMVKMLKQLGLEHVKTASNGEEAVKLVEQSIVEGYHFAVIFMDISMPVMNGIDAAQFIRTTLGYPYPIIALTGFSDAQSRNAIMSVSIQEVLTKPVMKNDITRVLQKYIGKNPR